jgi:predicted N-acyltransferase
VNKARRCGLNVRFDMTGELLEGFLEIYYGTLDRRSAAQSYYFPRRFFESLAEGLRGQFVFAYAFSGTRLVATELVLVSATHLYSLLGGTRADAFDSRPNDLLKHAVIEWGIEQGKTAYVLGGGKDGADGIFRYKLSFAPRGAVTFTVGKRIHDDRANDRLIRRREGWEQQRGNGWQAKDGYFPVYRA